MIVLDASAALASLLNAGPARSTIATEQLHAPHLIDAEVANGLRRPVDRDYYSMTSPPVSPSAKELTKKRS